MDLPSDEPDEDIAKVLMNRTKDDEMKRQKQQNAEQKDKVDALLQAKPKKTDLSTRTFSWMENQNQALSKWQDRLDIQNQGKSKGKMTGVDPSVANGVQSFSDEALDRLSKLKNLTEDFLSRQFKNSEILLDSDSKDGKIW